MPVNANFGILRPVDVGGRFQQSFQQGKQQRAQSETQNALSALAQDPNADINALAKYNPQLVMQVNQQRAQAAQKARQAQTTGDALTGNPQARGQVAYFDPELYLKLQGSDKEQAKESLAGISQVLQWADTPEKFDAVVRQMSTADPSFQEYLGRFGERESILAQAGDLVKAMTPEIGYVPADSLAYGKNAAGSTVLGATAQPQGAQPAPQAPPQQGGGQGATYATPEQVATLKASMGDQAAMEYLQSRGIDAVEAITEIDGKQYFQVNGQWFEN